MSKVTQIYVKLKNITAVISIRSKFYLLWFGIFNIKYLLIIIVVIRQECGDIERNPGPSNSDNITTIENYIGGCWRKSEFPKFCYMNCRSFNNKREQLSRFLKNLDESSFLVVTETWINEKTDIPEFYLCNSLHFVHQPRSSLSNVQRVRGEGIWAPKQFTVKMRNDLNTIKRSFFESLWIEFGKPLSQKLLINVA